jgi:hypothetical protein
MLGALDQRALGMRTALGIARSLRQDVQDGGWTTLVVAKVTRVASTWRVALSHIDKDERTRDDPTLRQMNGC